RSGVKTPPSSRKAWSASSATSDSFSEPGVFFTCLRSSGSSSYKSTSIGFGGSILCLTPSRPAINSAANVRYGFEDGSGARESMRFAFGDLEYTGVRQIAERLRSEYIKLIGDS